LIQRNVTAASPSRCATTALDTDRRLVAIALGAAEERGADQGGPTRFEDRPRDGEQARVRQLGRSGAVDPAGNAGA